MNTKSLLLVGGLLGFGIGFAFSWLKENGWPSILWHACLGAYVTGLLFRWWGRAWLKSLEAAAIERRTQPTPARPVTAAKPAKT